MNGKPQPHFFSQDELRVIALLRQNPNLMKPFLEMSIIPGSTPEEIRTGDDAEEATIKAIRNAGHALLQAWAEQRAASVESSYAPESNVRPHGKKK